MALPAARPAPFEVVHAVPPAQLIERFRRVPEDQVDQGLHGHEVDVLLLQPLGVALELRGELRLQHSLHPHGVEHLFRRSVARALFRDNLLRLADGL